MLYAMHYSATKSITIGHIKQVHTMYMVEAQSEAEAEGIGYRLAHFELPAAEGWQNYFVGVCESTKILAPESEWKRS
jgi:hypothetical protein